MELSERALQIIIGLSFIANGIFLIYIIVQIRLESLRNQEEIEDEDSSVQRINYRYSDLKLDKQRFAKSRT